MWEEQPAAAHFQRRVVGYINATLYFQNQRHVTAVKRDYTRNPNVRGGWFSTAFGSVFCEDGRYTFSINGEYEERLLQFMEFVEGFLETGVPTVFQL